MKNILALTLVLLMTACGYHLRHSNSLIQAYPQIKLSIDSQSLFRRPLINAIISSGVELQSELHDGVSELIILQDRLTKVIQSIGVNNQVQEYRLEYDIEFSIADNEKTKLHLEKDYSFDIQQIGGGQQEEINLRKQMAQDMAWAIIRQINISTKIK